MRFYVILPMGCKENFLSFFGVAKNIGTMHQADSLREALWSAATWRRFSLSSINCPKQALTTNGHEPTRTASLTLKRKSLNGVNHKSQRGSGSINSRSIEFLIQQSLSSVQSVNGAEGISDIEGKVATVAMSDFGKSEFHGPCFYRGTRCPQHAG